MSNRHRLSKIEVTALYSMLGGDSVEEELDLDEKFETIRDGIHEFICEKARQAKEQQHNPGPQCEERTGGTG